MRLKRARIPDKLRVIDSDKTYKAEMTALKKLMAPHTMPLDDRPSLASLNAVHDSITMKVRDGEALKDILPPLQRLRSRTHPDQRLQHLYDMLSKDKHRTIEYLLDDRKLIKYVHGPPGTGKSYLAVWLACIFIMHDPPVPVNAEDFDLPVDVGPQIGAEEFDSRDHSKSLKAGKPSDNGDPASDTSQASTKVLTFATPRLFFLSPLLFVAKFANVGRMIGRTTDEATGVIVSHLLKAEQFHNVDRSRLLAPMKLSAKAESASRTAQASTKILVVSGQNTAVADLVPRLLPQWRALGGHMVLRREPVVTRLPSWMSEGRDFVKKFAKIGRMIERTSEETTGSIVLRLLNAFSDQVNEFDREGRKARRSPMSLFDKAVELYRGDQKAEGGGKYGELAQMIAHVTDTPEQIYTLGKATTRLVLRGPQKDAILQADIAFSTTVGVADRSFRRAFRPHIIRDEAPRHKEVTFLILLAHFSPRAIFWFGDHFQLKLVIFSSHQHLKYKPPRSFKTQHATQEDEGIYDHHHEDNAQAPVDCDKVEPDTETVQGDLGENPSWSAAESNENRQVSETPAAEPAQTLPGADGKKKSATPRQNPIYLRSLEMRPKRT
ncbi:hypothetical protein Daus18300_008069 [Diaporthe australafricana]|uniref:DNA2/NAM7 helicase helicase domain-containing protein n=1 Tax=Diaporthe australafricana TaxID=127596 RepID=A0ABR3WJT1_9PEZI